GGASGLPPSEKLWRQTCPCRRISTSNRVDSAFTTDEPTPWRPPDTAYPPPPNLPPACSTVSTTSTVDLVGSDECGSTGMPRPLSTTRIAPSARIVTTIVSQKPASASSTELSTISYTRWCRPRGPVEPMYMPGRLRTASSPSSTWMSSAP